MQQMFYINKFLVKVRCRQEYYVPQVDQNRVRTHDLQIMNSTFHAPFGKSYNYERVLSFISASNTFTRISNDSDNAEIQYIRFYSQQNFVEISEKTMRSISKNNIGNNTDWTRPSGFTLAIVQSHKHTCNEYSDVKNLRRFGRGI